MVSIFYSSQASIPDEMWPTRKLSCRNSCRLLSKALIVFIVQDKEIQEYGEEGCVRSNVILKSMAVTVVYYICVVNLGFIITFNRLFLGGMVYQF